MTLNLFFQALSSDIRKSSEVGNLQVAVGLSSALKVYWFLTHWTHKFLKNLRRLFRRFGSDELEKTEEE